jgi:hypothetical protein
MMGTAVPLRPDFSVGELRQLAKRAEDVVQARRLLSLAAVLDGQSRKAAAEIGVESGLEFTQSISLKQTSYRGPGFEAGGPLRQR